MSHCVRQKITCKKVSNKYDNAFTQYVIRSNRCLQTTECHVIHPYSIIFAKFQVISRHYAKLPYFTPKYQITKSWIGTGTIGEILKTSKNAFNWLEIIFFIKEDIFHHFCKVSSDFKSICLVTIFHPQIPNYQIRHWQRSAFGIFLYCMEMM